MANVNYPFGFRMLQRQSDNTPVFSLGQDPLKFANGLVTKVARGDLILRLATGYVTPAVAALGATGRDQCVGIFAGCAYLSLSQGKRIVSPIYPGGDAIGDIDVQVVPLESYQNARMIVQASAGPIVFSDIGLLADIVYAAPTVYGAWAKSGVTLGAPVAAPGAATLPFKIIGLASQYAGKGAAAAGQNGLDNTTPFNQVIVEFNGNSAVGI